MAAEGEAEEPRILSLDDVEKRHILKVLRLCTGNKTLAARQLGISRLTLRDKLRAYGLAEFAGED